MNELRHTHRRRRTGRACAALQSESKNTVSLSTEERYARRTLVGVVHAPGLVLALGDALAGKVVHGRVVAGVGGRGERRWNERCGRRLRGRSDGEIGVLGVCEHVPGGRGLVVGPVVCARSGVHGAQGVGDVVACSVHGRGARGEMMRRMNGGALSRGGC